MSLMAAHERLEERVRVLEAKGAASSRNSSVAPSADTAISRQERRVLARAKTKELLKKDGQRRKAGGQPGHRGAGRGLLAEDQMKEICHHYPSECSGCGHEFAEVEKVPRWCPGRHQVAELPAITVEYVEHRTHRLRCPGWTLGEPFLRGTERIRTDHAGVGLGLAIVKSITRAHDGTLTLTPRAAGGLCVAVQLHAALPHTGR